MKTYGFIGLGHMGAHMARNLYKKTGNCLVWNRSQEKIPPVTAVGATAAQNVKEMAEKCDVIGMCLADPKAVKAVMFGPEGLLENGHDGQYIFDMSTIDRETVIDIAAQCAEKGITYIDVPVSGGVYRAETAELSLMCGCTEEEAEPIKEALYAIGRVATFLGARGNGACAKLIHNAVSLSTQLIDAEAIVMGAYLGIDAAAIIDVIQNGAAHNDILTYHGPRFLDHNYEGGHDVVLAVKDLDLCAQMCKELGCPNFTLNNAIQWYRQTMNCGYAYKDSSSLLQVVYDTTGPKKD